MIVKLADGTSVECEDEPMGGGAAGVTYYTRPAFGGQAV